METARKEFPPIAGLSETVSERIALRLRMDIVGGVFALGERLKIADLAARYGISHMPVREALRELEAEGLLEISPHRGATVRGVDETLIRNLYDIRESLECMLTRRCAERIADAGLAALAARIEAHERIGADDTIRALEANGAVHDAIYAAAGNPEAVRMLATGRALVQAMRVSFGYRPARARAIVAEHRALLEALRARDATAAESAARRHVIGARDDLLAGYFGAAGLQNA